MTRTAPGVGSRPTPETDTGAPEAASGGAAAALVVRAPLAMALTGLPVMGVASVAQHVGAWTPPVALASAAVGVALAIALVSRVPVPRVPPWAAWVVLGTAAGLGLWAALTHGEHVAVRRDPGAYATYALSLARFAGVPIDAGLDAFGLDPGEPFARVSAGANYQVPQVQSGRVTGLQIVPQFLIGTPALLTLGWWTAGWVGLFTVPAVLAAGGLCAFGALALHVLRPGAAVLATLTLAVSQPVLMTARQTFSEPPSLLYLMSGALVLVIAVRLHVPAGAADHAGPAPVALVARPWGTGALAALSGALIGANTFVRIDGIRESLLVLVVAIGLTMLRHPAALPLGLATVVATGAGVLAADPWNSPYVAQQRSQLIPLAVVAGVVLLSWAAARFVVVRSRVIPARGSRLPRTLALAAAGLLGAALLALASRPLWLVSRQPSSLPGANQFVTALQQSQGLPVDPTRTYAEYTLQWLTWWLGPVAVGLAAAGAVVAVATAIAQGVRGRPPAWSPVLLAGMASSLLALALPYITPDHPWADRRLVTTTLPTFALLAAAGVSWAWGTRATAAAPRRRAVAAALALAVVVPAAAATWPLRATRTEVGQPALAAAVCRALPDDAAVIALDHQSRVEWAPVLRARCDVPIVGVDLTIQDTSGDPELRDSFQDTVRRAASGARAGGRRPVLLAGSQRGLDSVAELDVGWTQVGALTTSEPERLLVERPATDRPLSQRLFLAVL